MQLTVVGCSGSFPGPESPGSAYLVEQDGYRVLLDLGSGALGPLQRYVALDALDAVLLTHLHPDHFADLCGYYVARRYHPTVACAAPLPVYGPAGTQDAVVAAYGSVSAEALGEIMTFHALGSGPLALGPFTVTAARTAHPVECNALRVEAGGRALVYTGDTGPCPAVTGLAAGADLLLCEAAFQDGLDNPPDLHLTGRQAGAMATAASVGRLVVTHVPPWFDPAAAVAEAAREFAGPVEQARSGATYEV
jgi:ribonuclease BN (tRNA processing enzyme)